jgi:hypothetical protein
MADMVLDTVADENELRISSISSRTAQNTITDILFLGLVQRRDEAWALIDGTRGAIDRLNKEDAGPAATDAETCLKRKPPACGWFFMGQCRLRGREPSAGRPCAEPVGGEVAPLQFRVDGHGARVAVGWTRVAGGGVMAARAGAL